MHLGGLVWFLVRTFLLKPIDRGETQDPLATLIVDVELFNAIAFKPKTVPTYTFGG
jgi:hypothetical protein